MARKHKHEDHTNHEAWAIPYGDLVTLLLAFFVVMYAVSSINEGKYRVLSDALSQAFGGPPKSMKPVQFGSKQQAGSDSDQQINVLQQRTIEQSVGGVSRSLRNPISYPRRTPDEESTSAQAQRKQLVHIGEAVEKALGNLISKDLVKVRRSEQWLEIEIRTDILFPSGVAQVSPGAAPVLERLALILSGFPNLLHIEGHTDDVPIATAAYPSNWELSAARAASVVHLFMEHGVDPRRMTVVGYGEFQPVVPNDSPMNRNRNRRVVLVVMGASGDAQAQAEEGELRETLAPAPQPPQTVYAPSGTLEDLHAAGQN